MLESVIEKAEHMGHLLVGQAKPSKRETKKQLSTTNANQSGHDDVYFLIKPFKDNEM